MTILLYAACMACGDKEDRVCPDSTCNDYLTQSTAQAAFEEDRECRKALDHDSDGIACEHVLDVGTGGSGGGTGTGTGGSGGSAGCPTTANCGCSNKNKDVCESACCKWIVGTGCRCK